MLTCRIAVINTDGFVGSTFDAVLVRWCSGCVDMVGATVYVIVARDSLVLWRGRHNLQWRSLHWRWHWVELAVKLRLNCGRHRRPGRQWWHRHRQRWSRSNGCWHCCSCCQVKLLIRSIGLVCRLSSGVDSSVSERFGCHANKFVCFC